MIRRSNLRPRRPSAGDEIYEDENSIDDARDILSRLA